MILFILPFFFFYSRASRSRQGTDSHRSYFTQSRLFPHILFSHFLLRPPLFTSRFQSISFPPPSLSLCFPLSSIRTREGCLHAYKAVDARARRKTWRSDLLERVLKTAVGGGEKEKGAGGGEGGTEQAGTAKTRPDGNDPKEFRGPSFLSSFLFAFSDSRLLLFPVLFRPTRRSPSLPVPDPIPLRSPRLVLR